MQSNIITNKEPRNARFPYNLNLKSVILSTLIIAGIQAPLKAQTEETYTKPSWWFGLAAGANFNFHQGSTQELNAEFTAPVAFHDGFGAGLYLAPTIEYYRPNSRWGMIFQFGYDSRMGKFEETATPCNCPTDLSTKLSYLTVEPSLRFAPFKSNLYLYAGPRFAYIMDKSFTYQLKANPDFPDQQQGPAIEGDFSNINDIQISMQIGAGYDIPLTAAYKKNQFVLSPYVAFHPYFGQTPRSIETWNITTLRVGAALKFGSGKKSTGREEGFEPAGKGKVNFSVNAPKNIPAERTVKETFPIINYVFFDLGSTEIPKRYVRLKQNQVKDFKEEQVELYTPENLSGRSKRQMIVYYNVLNILGDRMVKNPKSTIKLVGSSESGPNDAKAMAESVKTYLVNTFAIDGSRITTEGRDKPKIPSEQPGGTEELELLREGDRRVSIESSSPELKMEFQSGPSALKPVEILKTQEAPVESYVQFNNIGASEAFTSWNLEVKDARGNVQYFGPYTQDKVAIPGKNILGTQATGDYKVKMIGNTKDGKTVVKETNVHMVLWTPPKTAEVMRYSITYDFNTSETATMYDKYLTEVVVPKIPKNGKVIIHGYTDVIGNAAYNQRLSEARANDVKSIMQKGLTNRGRNDVTFEVYGYGEDTNLAQFDNKYPEQRFYNRTVVIDILPK